MSIKIFYFPKQTALRHVLSAGLGEEMTDLIEKQPPAEPPSRNKSLTLSDVFGQRGRRTRQRLLGLRIRVCGSGAGTGTAADNGQAGK